MTLFADGPQVLVDLSNVCRDSALLQPGQRADWAIFENVVKALHRAPIEFGGVHAVADKSLYRLLDQHGQAQLKAFKKKGLLEETALADERLIGYLFDDDSPFDRAAVMSRDMFDDFRRDYPQIQGSRNAFLEWQGDNIDRLSIRWRDMQQRTHNRISRKIEVGEMKARRLFRDTIRERAMTTDFRCGIESCLLAQLWPDRLREFPTYDRNIDAFVCPSCSQQLIPLGQRTPTTQLIVYFDGEEQLRILLEDQESIELGRHDVKGCVGLERAISADAVKSISRHHMKITHRDGQIFVADLGSKNGTRIEGRRSGQGDDLEPNRAVPFDNSLRAILPGGVSVELSGQLAPFEGERPISQTIAAPRAVLETVIDLG